MPSIRRRITQGSVAYRSGLNAEMLARRFLESQGYICIAERLRTPSGEIDLLMRLESLWVLCEVKWRKTLEAGLLAISARQQQRLIQAALWIMAQHCAESVRFDVCVVYPGGLHHLPNAFLADTF